MTTTVQAVAANQTATSPQSLRDFSRCWSSTSSSCASMTRSAWSPIWPPPPVP